MVLYLMHIKRWVPGDLFGLLGQSGKSNISIACCLVVAFYGAIVETSIAMCVLGKY